MERQETVDPDYMLERATVDRRGEMDSYMRFITSLARGVEMDEKTRAIFLGLAIGKTDSELIAKRIRPWQYLTGILIISIIVLILAWQNDRFQTFLLFLQLLGGTP